MSTEPNANGGGRTCAVCGAGIDHRASQARTCSRTCQDKASRDRVKAEANARRREKAQAKRQSRSCTSCGVSIDHLHGLAKVCSEACRIASREEYARQRWESGITQEVSNRSYLKHKEARRAAARSRMPKKGDPGYAVWAAKRSEYYRKNRAELLEKKRTDHSQHPERGRERSRIWRENNRERVLAKSRAYSAELAAARNFVREIQTKGLEALL